MGKSLNELFREKLKDKEQIPEASQFNADRIKRNVYNQIQQKPDRKRNGLVAMLLLLLIVLSGLNIHQYKLLDKNKVLLSESMEKKKEIQNELETIRSKQATQKQENSDLIAQQAIEREIVSYSLLPSKTVLIEITHNIRPIQKVEVPTIIVLNDESEPVIKEKNEEIDLPTFYESDELALKNLTIDGRIKRRKNLRNQ